MNIKQKVSVIVYTLDPEGNLRFLLRHNKPFGNYEDEWTIVFGNVEEGENEADAAKREVEEELGISEYEEITDLNYSIKYEGKHGSTTAKYFATRLKDINIPIQLNEESIGYDWALYDDAVKILKHKDEIKAFEILIEK